MNRLNIDTIMNNDLLWSIILNSKLAQIVKILQMCKNVRGIANNYFWKLLCKRHNLCTSIGLDYYTVYRTYYLLRLLDREFYPDHRKMLSCKAYEFYSSGRGKVQVIKSLSNTNNVPFITSSDRRDLRKHLEEVYHDESNKINYWCSPTLYISENHIPSGFVMRGSAYNELPVGLCYFESLTMLAVLCNSIETVPMQIGYLTNLTILDLSNNQIRTLPSQLSRLDKLVDLNISRNRIHAVPESISSITTIQELNLGHNSINSDYDVIMNLQQLIRLNLDGYYKKEWSDVIIRLPNLRYLSIEKSNLGVFPLEVLLYTQLTALTLRCNFIPIIPDGISGLTNLEYINLRNNIIDYLPETIYTMPKVRELILSHNYIPYFPDELWGNKVIERLEICGLNNNNAVIDLTNMESLKYIGCDKSECRNGKDSVIIKSSVDITSDSDSDCDSEEKMYYPALGIHFEEKERYRDEYLFKIQEDRDMEDYNFVDFSCSWLSVDDSCMD